MKKTLFSILFLCSIAFAQHKTETISTGDQLNKLMDGNKQFQSGAHEHNNHLEEIKLTSTSQHPYAVILACADSRLSPEIIFNESIGDLFVIRVAGNVIEPITLGSIEYAVEHLNVGYLLVLGHSSCGAVTAAVDGGEFTPSIDQLVSLIKPAVERVKGMSMSKEKQISDAVNENVKLQIENALSQSPLLKEFVDHKKLKISGAVYDITTGKVAFME